MHRSWACLSFAFLLIAGCATGGGSSDSGTTQTRDGGSDLDAAVVKPPDGGEPDGGPVCLGAMCGEECVDLQTDLDHCGDCDAACSAGQRCQAGACELDPCDSGLVECGGACVDPMTDGAHCGSCGNACDADESCFAGGCGPTTCPSGTSRCGAACVDLMSDAASCGGCGVSCATTEECRDGSCVDTCPAPSMRCTAGDGSVSCLDVTSDATNCGGCGVSCSGLEVCAAGSCTCEAPDRVCGGVCTDVMTSHDHCGSCGNACGPEQLCVDGACACPTGFTLCGSACTNTMIDDRNCGGCGTMCAAPAESCSGGSCVNSCGSGLVVCGGLCTDTSSSASHCGACGNACGAGRACRLGVCAPANDDRTNATTITLGGAEVVVTGSTVGASHDGPSPCVCTSGANVWYRFTLARRSIVYFDTAGSGFDTSLYITDSAGNAVPGQTDAGFPTAGLCNDDAHCSAGGFTTIRESRTAGLLNAGTYYVAVGGCATGAFTLRGQMIPDNVGYFFYTSRLQGDNTTSTVLVGTDVTTGTCGGVGSGEDVRWFLTCGAPQFFSLCASDGGSFERREGTSTYYDPAMYIRSGQTGAQVACNDDGGSMGGTNCVGTAPAPTGPLDTLQYGSRLNDVTVPRGIAVVFVDERSASGMNYTLRHIVR